LKSPADELEIAIPSQDIPPFVGKDEILSSECPSRGNAMKRDSSPLASYFQGRWNRAFLESYPVRRPSNSPANRRRNSAGAAFELPNVVDQNGPALENSRRLVANAASAPAVIRFFLGQT
jgi:hypothetical protein